MKVLESLGIILSIFAVTIVGINPYHAVPWSNVQELHYVPKNWIAYPVKVSPDVERIRGLSIVEPRNMPMMRMRDRMDAKNCDMHGFCESIENYPTDKISAILKKKENLMQYLGTVVQPEVPIGSRSGGGKENMCQITKNTIAPQEGVDLFGERRIIVNLHNSAYQNIVYEQCAEMQRTNSKCSDEGLDCEQKYNVVRLLALNPERDDLVMSEFKIPSNCVCSSHYV